jgi:hypothetical protein
MYFIVKNTLKNNRYYIPKYSLNKYSSKYSRKQYHVLSMKMKTKMVGVFENVTVVAV